MKSATDLAQALKNYKPGNIVTLKLYNTAGEDPPYRADSTG